MSANFVETKVIDRIITSFRTARAVVGMLELPTPSECSTIGRVMLKENARSVSYRYSLASGDEYLCDMEKAANSYRYDFAAHPLPIISDGCNPLEINNVLFNGLSDHKSQEKAKSGGGIVESWAAAGEFNYQACENEDYSRTAAGEFIAALEIECLAALELMRPAIRKARIIADDNKRESDKNALKIAVDRLISENPHLIPGGREVVEKNVRIALKLAFPGVKFSVCKDGYSATRINWKDGPTESDVSAIAERHKAGNFDGMTDCYEYSTSAFGEAFGDVQYVFTRREYSDSALMAAIDKVSSIFCVPSPSLEEYRRNGWNTYPMTGERETSESWFWLVNRVLNGTYE